MKRNLPQIHAWKTGVSETSGTSPSVPDARMRKTPNMRARVSPSTFSRSSSRPVAATNGRDRWALTVKAADRDCEILTLGSNPGRDEELAEAQAHLERGGTITNKRLRLPATRTTSAMETANG